MITRNEIAEFISYDPETGLFTNIKKRKGTRSVCGWSRSDGYVIITINYKRYLAHRLAWLFMYGEWPSSDIDHINGNPNDNRICNLREATHAQNLKNQKLRSNNTSGYKGVYFSKKNRNWVARIKVNYQYKHIGVYTDPETAHFAYIEKAKEVFGEFYREVV